jgi:hypothetical protein
MLLIVQTSPFIFGNSDPNISGILDAEVFNAPKRDTAVELDKILSNKKPKGVVLVAPYRENEQHYRYVSALITHYCLSNGAKMFTIVNMGYIKADTPNFFGENVIYYYPENIAERAFKINRIYSDLSSLGYSDIADEFCAKISSAFAPEPVYNGYKDLVAKLYYIKEDVRPKIQNKAVEVSGKHFSYSSPL